MIAMERFRWRMVSLFFLCAMLMGSIKSYTYNPAFGVALTASLVVDYGFVHMNVTDAVHKPDVNRSACHSCSGEKSFVDWVNRIGREYRKSPRKVHPVLHKFIDTNVTNFIIVDQAGNGDFSSVQDAIDAVPINNTEPLTIFMAPGIYEEKVRIIESKPFITLQGSGSDLTTIVWDDYAGKLRDDGSHLGTYHTATIHISAPYFTARGITFKNSAPSQAGDSVWRQAVALQITGDMAAFYECNFIGAQDTLYDHSGRHYFKNCVIQGSVDFIFGNGRSLYKDCQLNAIGTGALTAQKRQNASDNTGFSFVNCRVLGNGLVYLGRAWGPFSRVVFIYCYMDAVVNPGGWDDWGDSARDTTVFYGEFNCTGPGANDNQRVPWSYVLTEVEARPFLDVSFIEGDSWLHYL